MEAKVDSAAMPGMAYGKQGQATRCQLPGYRWQCLTVEPGQGPSVARHTAYHRQGIRRVGEHNARKVCSN